MGGRRGVVVVVVGGEGRRFAVGGSRWLLGWGAVGNRRDFEGRVVVVVVVAVVDVAAAGRHATHPSALRSSKPLLWEMDGKPVGTDATIHNNADSVDNDHCTPAAMSPRAAVADRRPSCSLAAVAKVASRVAGSGRSWRCREAVGRDGSLGGGAGSLALRRSSRWLPCCRLCSGGGGGGGVCEMCTEQGMDERWVYIRALRLER